MILFQSKRLAVFTSILLVVLFAWPVTPRALETVRAKNKYAAAIDHGTKVQAGDFAKTIVYFGAWSLVCDHHISSKRRVCVIEQNLSDSGISIDWRLALTTEGKPFLVFDVSTSVDHEEGLVLRIGKFVSKVPFVSCSTTCRGEIAFDRFIEEAITSGEMVAFGYSKANTGRAIIADTRGFGKALAASTKPPDIIFNTTKSTRKKAR